MSKGISTAFTRLYGKAISMRRTKLKTRYGISLEEYDQLFESQNGLCAICYRPERAILNGSVKRLAVDHSHKTGLIRGLLCNSCNAVLELLEKMEDNIEYFDRAIIYLKGKN